MEKGADCAGVCGVFVAASACTSREGEGDGEYTADSVSGDDAWRGVAELCGRSDVRRWKRGAMPPRADGRGREAVVEGVMGAFEV